MLAQPKTHPCKTSPMISAKDRDLDTFCALHRFIGKLLERQLEPTEMIRKC
jgi:hypothetical protein